MFGLEKAEVLIVGAGPVGQFAALVLARRGVNVRIVDRGVAPCAQSYALALHPASLALFRDVGLLNRALEHSCLVRGLIFYDGTNRTANVRIAENDDPAAALAVVRQDALEGLLEEALHQAGVQIEWRHEVTRLQPGGESIEATVDKFEKESRGYIVAHTEWVIAKSENLKVPFVIGADGHNSRVRRALKIDFPEVLPAGYYAVFEFKTDLQVGEEARIVMGDRTTDVLWPLPDGYCRWSFQLPDYRDVSSESRRDGLKSAGIDMPADRSKERHVTYTAPASEELDESHLRALIAERAPWFGGSIDEIAWRSMVRFERRRAGSFGGGRAWLAGDSAHLAGPIGVQSMNLGLAEANELANVLAGILRNGDPLSNLEDYGRRWQAEWQQLHDIGQHLSCESGASPWVREHAQRIAASLPGHGATLTGLAAQLGLAVTRNRAAAL